MVLSQSAVVETYIVEHGLWTYLTHLHDTKIFDDFLLPTILLLKPVRYYLSRRIVQNEPLFPNFLNTF